MPGHYVRSAILVGAIPLMAELGGDARQLAGELGINPAALSDPDLPVPAAVVLEFYERAARQTGCPSFGLRMAGRTGMSVIGALWVLLRQAGTLGQMVEDLAAHFDLYTEAAVVGVQPIGDDRLLTWSTLTGVAPAEVQMAEYSLAVMCGEIRRYAPSGWEPVRVQFQHAAPEDRAPLRRVFGSNLVFDAEHNGLYLERDLLDRPLRTDASRTRALLTHVLRRADGNADPGVAQRVDALVRSMLPYARCTLTDLSRAMGLAPRTLQDHLAAQGRSFEQIRDAARADLAMKFLRHSRMPLAEIADMLGYSEPSAFSRSFRRWHGRSARSVRTEMSRGARRGDSAASAPAATDR